MHAGKNMPLKEYEMKKKLKEMLLCILREEYVSGEGGREGGEIWFIDMGLCVVVVVVNSHTHTL